MYLVTREQMLKLEQEAIEQWGIPELLLMENAGSQLVEVLKKKFSSFEGMNVVILIGGGNNGGDGFVVARHLYNRGAKVKLFSLAKQGYQGSSLINEQIVEQLPIKVYSLYEENTLHLLKLSLNYADLIIDGIFGTGLNREITGRHKEVIEIVNKRKVYKVAIDIPSGLDGNTGEILGCCLSVDCTVAFQYPKVGLYQNQGNNVCGEIIVVDITIPKDCGVIQDFQYFLLHKTMVAEALPKRASDSHKGTFGHVLVVGGSVGMAGAVYLAASGALRSGAGLVSCAIEESIWPIVAGMIPEAMVHPLSQERLVEQLTELIEGKKAVVFGPGMGNDPFLEEKLKVVLGRVQQPLLIDADGINCLAGNRELLELVKKQSKPIIITPHPGEMARLLGISTQEVQQNRLHIATTCAQQYGVWVVLKGKNTIIADPFGRGYINPTGDASLATGGTGDVLAGMIGAFLAQGIQVTEACCVATYLHGMAGQEVGRIKGMMSSKAGDVIEAIPLVLKKEFLTDELQTSLGRN